MAFSISKSVMYFGSTLINLFIAVVLSLILVNLIRKMKAARTKETFTFYVLSATTLLVVICFSFLGLSIGLLIGLSQSPVVQVAIPGLLTFYGGFITFLFAKDSFKDEEAKLATILSAIAVSCFLIYGVELGAIEKNAAVKSAKEFDLDFLDKQDSIKAKYSHSSNP